MAAANAEAKLARIRNRGTLYEVVARSGDRTVLVVYCDRSKAAFWRAMTSNGAARGKRLVSLCGTETMDMPTKADRGRRDLIGRAGAWTIEFSGRTERDAISEGEHPRMPTVD